MPFAQTRSSDRWSEMMLSDMLPRVAKFKAAAKASPEQVLSATPTIASETASIELHCDRTFRRAFPGRTLGSLRVSHLEASATIKYV